MQNRLEQTYARQTYARQTSARPLPWLRSAALAACLVFLAPQPLLAQDSGQEQEARPATAGLAKPLKRVERAQAIIRQLEATKKRLEAAGALDTETRRALDRSIAHARALVQPAKSADLTDDERKALVEELAAEIKRSTTAAKGDETQPGDALDGWQARAVRRALEDVELGEEDRIAATKIIGEWFTAAMEAGRKRDSKGQNEAKQTRDRELRKLLGKKTAKQIIRNLNRMSGRPGGAGRF